MLITSTAVNNKTVATEALSTPGEPEMYADHIKYMYSESYNKVHVTTNLVRRRSKTAKCQTLGKLQRHTEERNPENRLGIDHAQKVEDTKWVETYPEDVKGLNEESVDLIPQPLIP